MRYMLMHKLDESVPANFDPSPEFMTRMGAFMQEVGRAGVLLAAEGLLPSSASSARITVADGKRTVTDGPFTETKELIAGFALIEVRSREEAVEWASRFADVFEATGTEVEIDVRRVSEGPADPA
ncbi:YciI family protein [Streptomyces sp. YIM 98790]|uniref:YciI family protein n=1 Tax=Streptomyces sp. YIM 98790 TaxID=2689077 RepID=UPI00140D1CCB|nr:YciI family protein [Streptomyces sp. YIM 98790]